MGEESIGIGGVAERVTFGSGEIVKEVGSGKSGRGSTTELAILFQTCIQIYPPPGTAPPPAGRDVVDVESAMSSL